MLSSVFEKSDKPEEPAVDTQELYSQIGQFKVEDEFLKKKFQETWRLADRVSIVSSRTKKIFVRRHCELLTVNRSRLYYRPVGEKPENIKMMEIMDKHLTLHPTECVVSLVHYFKTRGYPIGPKRIRRLLRVMGRQTIYRRKNLTKLGLKKFIKPYLLKAKKLCQVFYNISGGENILISYLLLRLRNLILPQLNPFL